MGIIDRLRASVLARILFMMLVTGLMVGIAFVLVKHYSGPDRFLVRFGTWAFAVVGIGIGIAIEIINYMIVKQMLVRPLKTVIAAAAQVASGDLKTTILGGGPDEIGQLSESFNHMVGSLTSILKKTQEAANTISELTNGIHTTAQEHEITATQESSAVNEAASTVGELNASAKQMTEHAKMVEEQVESMGEHISMLSSKAQQIAKITTTVEDTTQRINILALNVSIEAAKATGGGGGFGVIAREIRDLADRSSSTLEGISSTIEDIQSATDTTVMATEQALDSVKAITLAITQQGVATDQIRTAMIDINVGMSQTADGIRDTRSAVQELNDIVADMKNQVGAFKLE